MSLWWRHSIQRSIRARLTATIVAGTAAAAVALLTVMILLEASSVRRELLERTQVTARLVGEYALAAWWLSGDHPRPVARRDGSPDCDLRPDGGAIARHGDSRRRSPQLRCGNARRPPGD
jgi:hypothetical protein